jgi:hypothetical protein
MDSIVAADADGMDDESAVAEADFWINIILDIWSVVG